MALESRDRKLKQGSLHPTYHVDSAGSVLSIDLIGPTCRSGPYSYILTAQCRFSRYLFLVPLTDKTAQAVCKGLKTIFDRVGRFPIVKSDFGKEFHCRLQADFDKIYGVNHIRSLPYLARKNFVERSHSCLHKLIGKLVQEHSQWSQFLQQVAFIYNSLPHKGIGYLTPNYVFYGRELNTSVDLLLSTPQEGMDNVGAYCQQLADRM